MPNEKFRLFIRPMFFSPILDEFKDNKPVHAVFYPKCNYRCSFCSNISSKSDIYREYTLETFEQKLWKLLRGSKNFKFTGGEPTLNPYLKDIIRLTKMYSGTVYLDTNGSNPRKVKELVDEGLIDILGISIKGLDPEEALITAEISNRKICWDNVFESLRIGCEAENVKVLFTYVACEGYFSEASLERLAELLAPFPKVVLKINNCYFSERVGEKRTGLNKSEIHIMIEKFVERHPEFKGRTVLFKDQHSCVDQDSITHF